MKKCVAMMFLLLAACAANLPVYTRADVSDQQKAWDHFECERLSQRMVPGAYFPVQAGSVTWYHGGPTQRADAKAFDRCMTLKGYQPEEHK
jgi:hypothetical protein